MDMASFHNIEEAAEFLRSNMKASNVRADFPDAARYLGESGDARALEPLLEALREGSSYIRATAASGLGLLGVSAAIPHLIHTFLTDPALYVRCDAALALGRLKAEESLSLFLKRFSDEDFEVQKRIVMAISMMGTRKARKALEGIQHILEAAELPDGKRSFLRSLAEPGPKAVA
jgi:HEAT repeat protein